MHSLKLFLFLIFLFGISVSVFSQNIETTPSQTIVQNSDLKNWIDEQFEKGLDSFNIPGATFALMHGDSIIHLRGYGIGNIETQKVVDGNHSIFHLASISKTFVGVAIMQLYEQGKLKLDVDVNQYLKSFQVEQEFEQPITVFDLLTHTAGLDDRNVSSCVRDNSQLVSLGEHLKEYLPRQIRPAGEVLTYSNYGYALLGQIVAEISGMPFYLYVQQKILEPLQMSNSGFKRKQDPAKDFVTSYLQKGDALIPYPFDFQLYYPAGGFVSTADDMSRFISMLLNHGKFQNVQVLDSITVDKMFTLGFQHFESPDLKWMMGFNQRKWRGQKIVGHGGDILGYASEMFLMPEKNLGLFIAINASSIPFSHTRKFMSTFVDDLWEKLLPEVKPKNDFEKGSVKMGSVAAPLEDFEGTYRFTRYAENTLEKMKTLNRFRVTSVIEKNRAYLNLYSPLYIRIII